ncbi:MAG: hypothetical protein HON65_01150 [Rhodospirillales bacterium]|nr:hypothetical protein [Rhodospirillales bacterium]
MFRVSIVVLVVLLAGVIGGAVFLATCEIPAPSAPVEKVISDEKFPN